MENQNLDQNNQQLNNNDFAKTFSAKKRKDKIKKYIKRGIIVVVLLLLLAFCSLPRQNVSQDSTFNYDIITVDRGDIDVSVTGDGVIEANSIYSITPKVTGEILEDYVEVGAFVNKGDILYVIDSKDIKSSINQASIAVEQSNNTVNQANIAAEQSRINYNSIKDQLDNLKIHANKDGYISNLRIDKGSAVSNMMQICEISEKNAFEVTLEFRTSNIGEVKVGNKASLFYLDHFDYVDAYVTKVSDSTQLFSQGAQVTNVTLRVDTPGYSLKSARVEGIIYLDSGLELRSVNEGLMDSVSSSAVVSNSSGTVKELYIENGSYVHNGDLIAVLENSSINTQLENAEQGIKNSQVTIQNAQSSRKSAQNSLSQAKLQLDNYNIASPISGTVVYKNAKQGDVISTYQKASSNVMVTIADTSILKFEMLIDELDITKIKVGQEVIVTIEALDNKEFVGKVSNINTIGINAAGTTNYSVIVEVPGTDEIYSGMTVDATIKIEKRENVVRVPLTAVRKGDVIYKKSSNPEYQDSDTNVPKGYEKVKVELGLNNNEYIEILSGLTSGDVILTDKAKGSGVFSMENMVNMMREN